MASFEYLLRFEGEDSVDLSTALIAIEDFKALAQAVTDEYCALYSFEGIEAPSVNVRLKSTESGCVIIPALVSLASNIDPAIWQAMFDSFLTAVSQGADAIDSLLRNTAIGQITIAGVGSTIGGYASSKWISKAKRDNGKPDAPLGYDDSSLDESAIENDAISSIAANEEAMNSVLRTAKAVNDDPSLRSCHYEKRGNSPLTSFGDNGVSPDVLVLAENHFTKVMQIKSTDLTFDDVNKTVKLARPKRGGSRNLIVEEPQRFDALYQAADSCRVIKVLVQGRQFYDKRNGYYHRDIILIDILDCIE